MRGTIGVGLGAAGAELDGVGFEMGGVEMGAIGVGWAVEVGVAVELLGVGLLSAGLLSAGVVAGLSGVFEDGFVFGAGLPTAPVAGVAAGLVVVEV